MAKGEGSILGTILFVLGMIVLVCVVFGFIGAILEFLVSIPWWIWPIIILVIILLTRDR